MLGDSGAIVLLELVLTSRTSTISVCSSFASISASGVAEAHRQNQLCQTIYLQSVWRIEPFMVLVKIKSEDEFHWGAEQQQALDEIKEYLSKPPVLVPPQQDRPLSVGDTSIASVLILKHDD